MQAVVDDTQVRSEIVPGLGSIARHHSGYKTYEEFVMAVEAISTNRLLAAFLGGSVATRTRSVRPSTLDIPRMGDHRADHAARKTVDEVAFSEQAVSLARESQETNAANTTHEPRQNPADAANTTTGPASSQERTPEEEQELRELKQRDAEVRRHEQAHKTSAGPYARGGASFEYQTGPDGKQYAVGGEVSIDASEVAGDPQATIRKMQQVKRAALAPAQPSSQDRAVAAQAAASERKARMDLAEEKREQTQSTGAQAYTTSDSQDPQTALIDLVA